MAEPSRTKRLAVRVTIYCLSLSVFIWVQGIGYDVERGLLTVTESDKTKTGTGFSINDSTVTYHHVTWFANGTLRKELQAECFSWKD